MQVWSDSFTGPVGSGINQRSWAYETGHGIFGTGEIETMTSSPGQRPRHRDPWAGPETGQENCAHEACVKKRVSGSVMCRLHHFEMIRKRPPSIEA